MVLPQGECVVRVHSRVCVFQLDWQEFNLFEFDFDIVFV